VRPIHAAYGPSSQRQLSKPSLGATPMHAHSDLFVPFPCMLRSTYKGCTHGGQTIFMKVKDSPAEEPRLVRVLPPALPDSGTTQQNSLPQVRLGGW
jgi:hypothetical protein